MIRGVRDAFRQIRRSPGFALAVVLIIAVGIGVTTAVYSILYAVVLQPLPFPHPEELVAVSAKPWDWVSLPTVEDWQARSRSFSAIAAYSGWSPRVESSAGRGGGNAVLVSQNFLATLGVRPRLGRDFVQNGKEAECSGQAIVSNEYWRRMGGGDSLAGRTLLLDRKTYAVVGVLAPGDVLEGPDVPPAILTPIGCDPAKNPEERGGSSFRAIGRMRPGVRLGEAAADLAAVQRTLARDYPNQYPRGVEPQLESLAEYATGSGTRASLLAALGACGILLLISSMNLVNLLLARTTRRRAELALRTALGATPRDLLGQMLAENGSLTVLGAALGAGLAEVLVRTVSHLTIVRLPRLAETRLNAPVLIFSGLLAVGIACLLTWLPASRSLRPGLLSDLSQGGGRSSAASGLRGAGRLLVAAQLAMATVLIASAGWMVASVTMLLHQPLGFAPEHLLLASLDLRGQGLRETVAPEKTLSVLDQALERVRRLPGVLDAAAANDKPLGGRVNRFGFCSDVHREACHGPNPESPDVFLVTPTYFRTVGQELIRGRGFDAADDGRNHVAIVNRSLALQQWPGESPIGHRIYSGDLQAWATVVGEVGDVHSFSLERAPVPNLYLPEADGPDTSMTLMVRTTGDPEGMVETVRRLLRADAGLNLRYVESMPELMAHQVALRSFSMWVAVGFGLLALGLAVVGTYSVIAYEVSLREREVGIRLALGSSREAIVGLLVRQESRWIAGGMVCGLAGAVATGFLLRAQFFHTGAASAPVLGGTVLLLAAPALAAVVVPGRRASSIDPAVTLRRE